MTAGIGAADAAIYTGVCLDNNDPAQQGRIKYCVPQLSGTAAFGWAIPVTPGYTPVGSTVNVAFEGGDRNRPLFWPDQLPQISYPTYAAMAAANPIDTTPVGTEFYVVDHGGNVRLQNTGVTPASLDWQWLPNGYQTRNITTGATSTTGSTAQRVCVASFNNPSLKRIYEVTASCSVYTSAANTTAALGIFMSATSPPTTRSVVFADYAQYSRMIVPGTTATTASYLQATAIVFTLPVGVTWFSTYIINVDLSGATVNAIGYPSIQLLVKDIGATT